VGFAKLPVARAESRQSHLLFPPLLPSAGAAERREFRCGKASHMNTNPATTAAVSLADGSSCNDGALGEASMQHTLSILTFQTQGRGIQDVTAQIAIWLSGLEIGKGILTLFCQHSSAGLLVSGNASRAVQRDLLKWFDLIAPAGAGYEGSSDGPDDTRGQIKSMLGSNSLSIPVADGRMLLGKRQGVFLAEHRSSPHKRSVAAHLLGE